MQLLPLRSVDERTGGGRAMTWYTDDRHLYWEQRRLDELQAEAFRKMQAAKEAQKPGKIT